MKYLSLLIILCSFSALSETLYSFEFKGQRWEQKKVGTAVSTGYSETEIKSCSRQVSVPSEECAYRNDEWVCRTTYETKDESYDCESTYHYSIGSEYWEANAFVYFRNPEFPHNIPFHLQFDRHDLLSLEATEVPSDVLVRIEDYSPSFDVNFYSIAELKSTMLHTLKRATLDLKELSLTLQMKGAVKAEDKLRIVIAGKSLFPNQRSKKNFIINGSLEKLGGTVESFPDGTLTLKLQLTPEIVTVIPSGSSVQVSLTQILSFPDEWRKPKWFGLKEKLRIDLNLKTKVKR